MKDIKIYKTEEWDEEDGDCLFLHIEVYKGNFDSFTTIISNPNSSDFEEYGDNFFTHFIKLDFNYIIEKMLDL